MRDWDDAFSNMAYIPGSEHLPPIWAAQAAAYRKSLPSLREDIAYGAAARQKLDLILPDGEAKGLAVFVHGGFWLRFTKSDWTDLAEGARARGWAVALPSYTLAPEARIAAMTQEIALAIAKAASLVAGPIRLMGHSAGGHLVSRMVCDDSPLEGDALARIEHVLSISGLHDLRPLRKTGMNNKLGLTEAEAVSESPALHLPLEPLRLTCWVGGAERPEFQRQSRLMAAMWEGEADVELVVEPDKNHFTVLDGLKKPDSAIITAFLDR
ncbi:alpha/beta hydrolase [Labrys neptuniae]